MLAVESARNNIPTCVSMASTTTLEKMYETQKVIHGCSYIFSKMKFRDGAFGKSKKYWLWGSNFNVDVPVLSRRTRDDKNGFSYPFKIGPKQFLILPLIRLGLFNFDEGIPKPMNYVTSKSGDGIFKRKKVEVLLIGITLKEWGINGKANLLLKE